MLSVLELFVGKFELIFGEVFELFVALWVKIAEAGFLNFDTDATHLEAVGEWREDLK